MFDFVVKLFGSKISSIIYFLSFNVSIGESGLTIETTLNAPVTKEIASLVKQKYRFQIEYYSSIIVNKKKVYRSILTHSLEYTNGWFCNGKQMEINHVQENMGHVIFTFSDYTPQNGDEIICYVKASIKDDTLFEKSTGLRTKILWENYIPRLKKTYRYQDGVFQ